MRWLNEPLLHFAVVATCLFYFSDRLWPSESVEPTRVVVSTDDLVSQLQYQTGIFDSALVRKRLDKLPSQSLADLVNEFVTEEVLYRESISLGLDKTDRAIRLRLGQQVELLMEDLGESTKEITDVSLESHFEQYLEEFLVEGSISFLHLFFNKDQAGDLTAKQRAREYLINQQAGSIGAESADRFLYHSQYVDRTPRFVESHFGKSFANQVFDKAVDVERWSAPIKSIHGYHLVYIKKRSEDRVPKFDEVKGPVLSHFLREQRRHLRLEKLGLLINKYQVKLPEDIESRLTR